MEHSRLGDYEIRLDVGRVSTAVETHANFQPKPHINRISVSEQAGIGPMSLVPHHMLLYVSAKAYFVYMPKSLCIALLKPSIRIGWSKG